jgi:hypothetical protein
MLPVRVITKSIFVDKNTGDPFAVNTVGCQAVMTQPLQLLD